MKTRIQRLEKETENRIKKERRSEIEIFGITKETNEKLDIRIIELARAAEVEVKRSDIENCFRLNAREGKEGAVIVKFKELQVRDNMYKELKKLKPKLEHLKMQPKEKKIYVNEALTPNTKSILYRVKQKARESNWHKVWTYSGTVFLKMEKEGRQIKIDSIEELEILI